MSGDGASGDWASPVSTEETAAPQKAPSLSQQVAERLLHDLTTDFGNRRGQWNVLRTNLDAVLGVAAFLDAAIAHQRRQTLALQRPAGRMRVEQAHLRDSRGGDGSPVLLSILAGVHTAATLNGA